MLEGDDVGSELVEDLAPGWQRWVLVADDEQVVVAERPGCASVFEADRSAGEAVEVGAPLWAEEVDVGTCAFRAYRYCPEPSLDAAVAGWWELVGGREVADADEHVRSPGFRRV